MSCRVGGLRRLTLSAGGDGPTSRCSLPELRTRPPVQLCSTARVRVTRLPPHARTTATLIALRARPHPRRRPSLLRTWILAAALLCLTVPAGAEARSSSWSSDRMRLRPPPRVQTDGDELHGNCAGLTVMTRTRIE